MKNSASIHLPQVWVSENQHATLLLGDCPQLLQTMKTDTFDCVVTSPPYNLIRNWTGGGPESCLKSFTKKLRTDWYPDSIDESSYQDEQRQVVAELVRVCRGSVWYNHKVRYAWKRRNCIYHPLDWLRDCPIWCEIIWDRGGSKAGSSRRCHHADERIYQIGRPRVWHQGPWTTIWRIAQTPDSGHPCSFPVELPRRCIELDPKYMREAIRRIELAIEAAKRTQLELPGTAETDGDRGY